jgi:hypothetical protein
MRRVESIGDLHAQIWYGVESLRSTCQIVPRFVLPAVLTWRSGTASRARIYSQLSVLNEFTESIEVEAIEA